MRNNVSIERIRVGMTREDLASKLGYSGTSSIRRIESGEQALTDKQLVTRAGIFGCSIDYLLRLSDYRKPMVIAVSELRREGSK